MKLYNGSGICLSIPGVDLYRKNPFEVLLYWMVAREGIRRTRLAGIEAPWTDDPILRTFKFTNVFRVYDRVTQHYLSWVRAKDLSPDRVVFNSLYYRIINWPDTMDETGRVRDFPKEKGRVWKAMADRLRKGEQMYTGAYMITAEHKPGLPKYLSTMKTLEEAWKLSSRLALDISPREWCRLPQAWLTDQLRSLPRVGGFIAYEAVTDCTYSFLTESPDREMWANAGPGAVRGLNRLAGEPLTAPRKPEEATGAMRALLPALRKEWPRAWLKPGDLRIGMREVEHSLCEFDKYCRVLLGEGSPRSRYKGDGK